MSREQSYYMQDCAEVGAEAFQQETLGMCDFDEVRS